MSKLFKLKVVTISLYESLKKKKVRVKNDVNVPVCKLNYMSHIEYVTEIIMKTARVYVVGPQNTFAIHHREVNEITARGDCSRATHVTQRR